MEETLWIIYLRCSTEEQATEGLSIEMQKSNCEKIINSIPGAKIYKIYSDEGLSGSDPYIKRKQLMQMLGDIKEHGNIYGIALFRADRLTRLSNEQEQLLHILMKYGVKDIKCYSNEVLVDFSPQGEFVRRTFANLNELEVKVLSFRIKSAMQLKAESGTWKGGHLYGFHWNKETKRMIPIDNLINQIKFIYDLYTNELKGAASIRDVLNNKGDLYEKNGQKSLWNKERVLCVLKSPLYCGYQYHNTRYGKFDIIKDKKFKNKSEWELYPAKFIDPIITKKQWDKAQEIKSMRGKKIISSIPNSNTWLLSGIMYCGCCGEKFLGHPIINKRKSKRTGEIREYDCSNYICSGRTLKGNGFCNAKQIVKSKIEKQIELIVAEYLNNMIEKLDNDTEIKKLINRENKVDNSRIIEIKKQLNGVDKKIEKYYRDYEEGDISAKIFNKAMERLEEEKELLQKQLDVLEVENSKNNIVQKELVDIKSKFINWLREYQLLDNTAVAKKKIILSQIIKHIEIIPSKDKSVEDRLSIVFKTSESMYNKSNSVLVTTLNTHAVLSDTTNRILLNLEKK